jgi:hypothetical protein
LMRGEWESGRLLPLNLLKIKVKMVGRQGFEPRTKGL